MAIEPAHLILGPAVGLGEPQPEPERGPGHITPAGGENLPTIAIEDNQHEDCFSIRYTDPADGEHDLIHFCDWPALRAAIDRHQQERGGRT